MSSMKIIPWKKLECDFFKNRYPSFEVVSVDEVVYNQYSKCKMAVLQNGMYRKVVLYNKKRTGKFFGYGTMREFSISNQEASEEFYRHLERKYNRYTHKEYLELAI